MSSAEIDPTPDGGTGPGGDPVGDPGTDPGGDRGTDRGGDRGTDRGGDRGTDRGGDRGSDRGGDPVASGGDRTARARIRDAAIACFAASGVAGTSVRLVAERAEVSPPLVIHHFGSKDRLRVACDEYVVACIREQKQAAMAEGPGLDPLAALRRHGDGPPLLRYLARTLIDGSPHVAEVVDEMVADAVEYMADGERAGIVEPSDDPRGRAAVLTLWSLGALVLHEHASRLLGAELLDDPAHAMSYFLPALEIMGRGVITPEAYERITAGLRSAEEDEA